MCYNRYGVRVGKEKPTLTTKQNGATHSFLQEKPGDHVKPIALSNLIRSSVIVLCFPSLEFLY